MQSLESIKESLPAASYDDRKMESIEIEEKLAHTIEKSESH